MLQKIVTADGSNTFFNSQFGEHYHSIYGAVTESRHVFVNAGLAQVDMDRVHVLEVGFGTGLNFLLSLDYCHHHNRTLNYVGVEPFPFSLELLEASGYSEFVEPVVWKDFISHYKQAFEEEQILSGSHSWRIFQKPLMTFSSSETFDVVYFDAFSPGSQPELWTEESIAQAGGFLKRSGCLVTYSVTGKLKNIFSSLGYAVERLPGAPGKREMLRAKK